MNPSSGEAPKFELPVAETAHEAGVQPRSLETVPSQEASVGKRAPSSSLTASVQSPPLTAVPTVAAPSSYQSSKAIDDSSTHKLAASEADRIEKEWIHKAKAIVSKTQDDPHEQNNEMGKVKADYIKRRFNKTIPTDDTVAA